MVESLSNSAHLHLLLNHVPTVGFGLGLIIFLVAYARRNDDLKRTGLVIFFVVAVASIATYVTGNGAEAVLREVPIVTSSPGNPTVVTTRWPHGLKTGALVSIAGHVGGTPSINSQRPQTVTVTSPTQFTLPINVTQGGYGGTLTASDAPYPPGVAPAAIRVHEDAALLAFVLMEITGFFAWLAMWQWRRVPRLPGWMLPTVLVLSLATFGLMARAAQLGGDIHHEEIWLAQPASAAASAAAGQSASTGADQSSGAATVETPSDEGTARAIGGWVTGQTWVWPTCETLHFIGLCMLFSVVIIVDLRMLGMIKGVPYSAVYQLLPIGMLGFGINLITGMMFFIGTPGQYVHNITFFWKIVFIVLGGLNVLYFMLFDEAWAVGPGDDAPRTAKVAAASAIFIWVAVLFCGHMLPFIGNAF